jgi:hypothetical protein
MTTHFMDEIRAARLAEHQPPHKPWHGQEPEHTQQRKLLDGMDCLTGQLDLFDAPADDEPPERLTAAEIEGVIDEAREHRGTCPECGEKDRPLCEDVTGMIGRRLCIACWSWATDNGLRRLEPTQ